MSPVRKPQPDLPITVEVIHREVDDPNREQALVRFLAGLVTKRRAGQR